MRQDIEQNVRVEIQKSLAQINDITLKIKKELSAINDLVRENGHLNIAVGKANDELSKIVQDMGIVAQAQNLDEDEDETENLMIPMPPDRITEKIMTMIHNTEESQ